MKHLPLAREPETITESYVDVIEPTPILETIDVDPKAVDCAHLKALRDAEEAADARFIAGLSPNLKEWEAARNARLNFGNEVKRRYGPTFQLRDGREVRLVCACGMINGCSVVQAIIG